MVGTIEDFNYPNINLRPKARHLENHMAIKQHQYELKKEMVLDTFARILCR